MKRVYTYGVVLFGLMLGGCQTSKVGPRALRSFQGAYSEAVALNENEQLLANIVRLRYRDNPVFMEVSGIKQDNAGNNNGELSGDKTIMNAAKYTGKLASKLGFNSNNSSSLSFARLNGKDFVQKLMTPIQLPVIISMFNSGWKPERVFNLCVERVNDLHNAPTADGPTPEFAPEYETFYRWTNLLGCLERNHCIDFGEDPDANFSDYFIRIRDVDSVKKEIAEFKRLAGLKQDSTMFKLKSDFVCADEKNLTLRSRTLLGIIFFLSQGVEVPECDKAEGLVTVTKNLDGSVFDWEPITKYLLTIHFSESKKRPENAYVSYRYRGKWFYIDDCDKESKSTFMLMSQIYILQSATFKSQQSVLVL